MRRRISSVWIISIIAALALAFLPAGPSGADTSSSSAGSGGLLSGLNILKSRTFAGSDGHLYTTSDLRVNGRTLRGVTAPGGRLGDRWEWVESIPVTPAGEDAESHSHAASTSADGGYAMQTGSAAGTTMSADASPSGSGLGPASFATMYGFGWCVRDLGAPYRINTARAPLGAVTAIRSGFNVWASHPSSWMTFRYNGGTSAAKSSNDGANVVWFSYDPGAFLGRTWVYGQGTRITGFDMQLNTKYPLTIGGSGYDLQSLVAHEAGHAAGFGHTSSAGNLMYGGGQPPRAIGRSLGAQDAAGLNYLYPYGHLGGKVISLTAPKSLKAGATGTVTAVLENTGRTPWGGNFGPIRIRTHEPYGRTSPFRLTSWLGVGFPTRSFTTTCKGERVQVSWQMHAPSTLKTYSEAFVPAVGDENHFRVLTGSVLRTPITVTSSSYGGGSGSGTDSGSGSDDHGCFLFLCW